MIKLLNKMILNCLLCLLFLFPLVGCGQKPESPGQEEEASSVELTLPQVPKLSVSYKPTSKDIQIALRNAGFYHGNIDGDIGPQTKEAIREFQMENNLIVDGKVGPKTWVALSEYLHQNKEEKLLDRNSLPSQEDD